MRVLIVESDPVLGVLWCRHLERSGKQVTLVRSQEAAVAEISSREFAILVLDLVIAGGSAFAIADYAGFRPSRDEGDLCHAPELLLGWHDFSARQQCLRHGATGHCPG